LDATVLSSKYLTKVGNLKVAGPEMWRDSRSKVYLAPQDQSSQATGSQAHRPGGSFRKKEMTRNNNYRLIDTRIDKGVLGLHDPTRPFCVVVTDRTTGRIMHVWRYASKKGAEGRMRQCRRPI